MTRPGTRPIRTTIAIVLLTSALAAAPSVAQPEETPTHLIQISLLAAAKSGPNELADLPANTRAAIEDVRQFLPFKSYRLLDTALLRAHRGAQTTLTGPGDREFRVAFTLAGLTPPGSLLVRSFEVVEKFVPVPPAAPVSVDGGGKAAPASPASRLVMASSFEAEVGQTVVVGTSRLNGGDEALMVLFTALP